MVVQRTLTQASSLWSCRKRAICCFNSNRRAAVPIEAASSKRIRWISVGRSFHCMITAAPRNRRIRSSSARSATSGPISVPGGDPTAPPSLSQRARALARSYRLFGPLFVSAIGLVSTEPVQRCLLLVEMRLATGDASFRTMSLPSNVCDRPGSRRRSGSSASCRRPRAAGCDSGRRTYRSTA